MPLPLMALRCVSSPPQRTARWRSSLCLLEKYQSQLPIALLRKFGFSRAGRASFGAKMIGPKRLFKSTPAFQYLFQLAHTFNFAITALKHSPPSAPPCRHGRVRMKHMQLQAFGSYQLPMLGIEAHGSCTGRKASLACSTSIEIPSGVFINAMRPSRGGRFITTPCFINISQYS